MNPNAQAYLNNHLARTVGAGPGKIEKKTGRIFGDGNVINAVRVFEGLRGLKGIENMIWFLRFEIGFNQERGNLDDQAFLKSDLARGERLLTLAQKRLPAPQAGRIQ